MFPFVSNHNQRQTFEIILFNIISCDHSCILNQSCHSKKKDELAKSDTSRVLRIDKLRHLCQLAKTRRLLTVQDKHHSMNIAGKTPFRRPITHQLKLSKHLIVSSHFSLSLMNFDFHLCLSICCCRKHLPEDQGTKRRWMS